MPERIQIEKFRHLPGVNCLSTAIRNVLNHCGYRFAEAMIFGIAEGLGFQFKVMPELKNPYLSGAGKGLVESFCRNVHLQYEIRDFDSDIAAMDDLVLHIKQSIPLIVQVDLAFLPYLKSEIHFSAHRVIPVGYDRENVYLSDTGFQEIQSCPLDAFVKARSSSHPPFTLNRRRVKLECPQWRPFVEESVTKALYNLQGKFAEHAPGYNLEEIPLLKDRLKDYKDPRQLYVQIEKAGTGGGLSRKLFAEFLDLSFQLYSRANYLYAHEIFSESASLWREIALSARESDLTVAADRLNRIYQLETDAVGMLAQVEADDL